MPLLMLLRSRWFYIIVLAVLSITLGVLLRAEHARLTTARTECQLEQEQATTAALREQAKAWDSIYSAQQEAVARMAQEAGAAAATAREWRRRYEAAKATPACKAWAEAAVQCPVE